MARICTSMESRQQQRQQVLAGRLKLCSLLLPALFLFALVRCVAQGLAGETNLSYSTSTVCRFAIALPELDGPITLGIFSNDGSLVRLLYSNAPVASLPAGLNGLLISWDGNNDAGSPVPNGVYRARGLVHGRVQVTPLPPFIPTGVLSDQTLKKYEGAKTNQTSNSILVENKSADSAPLPWSSISVRAPADALLTNRPLLAITAALKDNQVLLSAEGLPLLSIPIDPSPSNAIAPALELHQGKSTGNAELVLISGGVRTSYLISGLDQIVPFDAGDLPMPPQVFQPDDSATPDPGKTRS